MFENASRKKYRFESAKGELTVENLWDLPLQSRSGFDLDTIARGLNAELKETAEESFVEANVSPRKAELDDKFEIVKHIIKVKLEENSARLLAAKRKEDARKLEDLLSRKKDQALEALSEQEIEAKLAALRG